MKVHHIAVREMQEHILSLRFYFSAILCFTLMVLSAFILAEETAIEKSSWRPMWTRVNTDRLPNGPTPIA